MTKHDILTELDIVLEERKTADPNGSYVASLYDAGLSKILEKVGEEATEVVIAAKDVEASSAELLAERQNDLVKEVADLWFHSIVTLQYLNLSTADVLEVLGQRFGIGGLDEKASGLGGGRLGQ